MKIGPNEISERSPLQVSKVEIKPEKSTSKESTHIKNKVSSNPQHDRKIY